MKKTSIPMPIRATSPTRLFSAEGRPYRLFECKDEAGNQWTAWGREDRSIEHRPIGDAPPYEQAVGRVVPTFLFDQVAELAALQYRLDGGP